mmetsp:Transcript_24560/g.48196  ORF Transcript_24560/g.48196 Transcript_24560/m.48196 type:complete len:299 (-) Transcript_24560:149-1045(-)
MRILRVSESQEQVVAVECRCEHVLLEMLQRVVGHIGRDVAVVQSPVRVERLEDVYVHHAVVEDVELFRVGPELWVGADPQALHGGTPPLLLLNRTVEQIHAVVEAEEQVAVLVKVLTPIVRRTEELSRTESPHDIGGKHILPLLVGRICGFLCSCTGDFVLHEVVVHFLSHTEPELEPPVSLSGNVRRTRVWHQFVQQPLHAALVHGKGRSQHHEVNFVKLSLGINSDTDGKDSVKKLFFFRELSAPSRLFGPSFGSRTSSHSCGVLLHRNVFHKQGRVCRHLRDLALLETQGKDIQR